MTQYAVQKRAEQVKHLWGPSHWNIEGYKLAERLAKWNSVLDSPSADTHCVPLANVRNGIYSHSLAAADFRW